MQKQANNITFGYSDSEDRIWLRLLLTEGGEARLWLTRRLCIGICNGVAGMIEKYTPASEQESVETYLKKEFYEASRSTFDPTPPPPSKETSNETLSPSMGLCRTAYIDAGDVWRLRLVGPQQIEYVLPLDRTLTQKVLVALFKQAHIAGWSIPSTHNWLRI